MRKNYNLFKFLLIMLMALVSSVSCAKAPNTKEEQKNEVSSTGFSPETVVHGQSSDNPSAAEEISVVVNGAQIELGEVTLGELIQKSGFTCEYKLIEDDDHIWNDTLTIELGANESGVEIYVEIEGEKAQDAEVLKKRIVRGITVKGSDLIESNIESNSVLVGGVHPGSSADDANNALGQADMSLSYYDGYGIYRRYKKDRTCEIAVDDFRGIVQSIEIRRMSAEEVRVFEDFAQRWNESDDTKEVTVASLSIKVPVNARIVNSTAIQINDSLQCEVSEYDRWSDEVDTSDEEEAYHECFVELLDTRYGIDAKYEKGYLDSKPAVYFIYRYTDEDDGTEYYHNGVLFVAGRHFYRAAYITPAADESNRLIGNKTLSSIKVTTVRP